MRITCVLGRVQLHLRAAQGSVGANGECCRSRDMVVEASEGVLQNFVNEILNREWCGQKR